MFGRGLAGGGILVAELMMKVQAANQDSTPPSLMTKGLWSATVILWGLAGLKGSRLTGNGGIALLAGGRGR